MTWFVEWVPDLKRRAGRMLPIEKVEKLIRMGLSGNTSVYQFNEGAAEVISESGSSKGLDRFPCSSRVLLMDCDHGQQGMVAVSSRLKKLGLRHSIYDSGGKGYHFYIPMVKRMTGVYTPYSQKQWIVDNGFGDLVDTNIYRASSLISAPGRLHPRTGQRKRYYKELPGQAVEIPYLEPETLLPAITEVEDTPLSLLAKGFSGVLDLVSGPSVGDRHVRIWGTCRDLAAAGVPQTVAETVLLFINSTWPEPKQDDEVLEAVGQAYHYRPLEREHG